jgi:hypothetical protein
MTRETVEQTVQELAKGSFNSHPEDYELDENNLCTNECAENILGLAKAYYDTRTDEEVERDEQLEISLENYASWCQLAFTSYLEGKGLLND